MGALGQPTATPDAIVWSEAQDYKSQEMPGEQHWAHGAVSPLGCSQATDPCAHPSTGESQPLLGCPC